MTEPTPQNGDAQRCDNASPVTPAQSEASQPSDPSAPAAPTRHTDPGYKRPETFKDFLPWDGAPSRSDKFLLGALFVIPVIYLILLPLRPMMIVSMPLALSVISGAKTVIAGAGALAAVEGHSLLLVIFLGWLGMMKFDWLWWFAGRRWGERVVQLFANTPTTYRRAEQIRKLPRWVLIILLILGRFPGVPGTIVWLICGWSEMRFWVFFLCNGLGAAILSTVCACIGFAIGEPAVDLLKLIDRYSLWVSLAIIFAIVFYGVWKDKKRQAAQG